MEPFSHKKPDQRADQSKKAVLPVDVGSCLFVIKSQHFQCRQFSDPLRYIDIREVKEDKERQDSGSRDDDHNDRIDAPDAALKSGPHLIYTIIGDSPVNCNQLSCRVLFLRSVSESKQDRVVKRPVSRHIFPAFSRHVDIVIDIVFRDV